MKNSERNRMVLENFILHLTHCSRDEVNEDYEPMSFTPKELYMHVDDYIKEDHVDGEGNMEGERIPEYLEQYGSVVEENETDSYVELMMDDHKCVQFQGKQYYIPENSMFYDDEQVVVYNYLVEHYHVK